MNYNQSTLTYGSGTGIGLILIVIGSILMVVTADTATEFYLSLNQNEIPVETAQQTVKLIGERHSSGYILLILGIFVAVISVSVGFWKLKKSKN